MCCHPRSDDSAGQTIGCRSHDAVIRVYDAADNVIETHEQAGEFKVWSTFRSQDIAQIVEQFRLVLVGSCR
jgi:hypothetical protein